MNNDTSVQYSTYTELLYSLTSSTFTHKPPIHCSLSRHMVFISVTGSLGQCRDRSSQVNTDMFADCGREQVSPCIELFILAVSNTRTKPTLYVYTHRLTVTACPRISLLDSS